MYLRVLDAGWWQPEEAAGPLSRLLFSYCNGILAMGSRKILVQDDLWDVSRRATRSACPSDHDTAPTPDALPE